MHRPPFHRLALLIAFAASGAVADAQPATRVRGTTDTLAAVARARPVADAAPATGRTVLGATAGAVLGGVVGGVIGAATASRERVCQVGDPDGCLGATIPRALWGTGVGITLGTPVGAHLGSGRRGNLVYAMLASAGLFAGELIALDALVDDGRTEHKGTVVGIAVSVPVLQIIATTLTERAGVR
jgi:hypothetical protein